MKKLKNLFLLISNNIIIISTIFLLIIILFFSGFLTTLELAIYDFNFWVRPDEPVDSRIVIVGWDEPSIQMLEENTISDDTLVSLLRKINRQKPRIIGLDLYRDIPVFSPRLSDRANVEAYNSLQQIFRFTPNLIGIEKVVEPTINPPRILKEQESTTASDLPSDRDQIIRRSFVFPQSDDSGKPAGIPYFGVALGYEYLSREGWNAKASEDNALDLLKSDKIITINPLKNFAGIPQQDRYGFNFLVNWRKGNPAFKKVSVGDVVFDKVPPESFHDRLVIIGNVSASTADRHFIPLNRWSERSSSWIYGVEIPAQVASSIISSAKSERPLISPVNRRIDLTLIFISIWILVNYTNSLKDLRVGEIYSKSLVLVLIISLVLFLLNIIFFTRGWWIPIALPFSSIWIVYLGICYYIYLKKKRKNIEKLESFLFNFSHSLGNPLNSINESRRRIQISLQELEENLLEECEILPDKSLEKIGTILKRTAKRTANIEQQAKRITRYQKRLIEFVNYGHLDKTNTRQKINVNNFVEKIIARFIEETDYEHNVTIDRDFDPLLTQGKLDPMALEIVFENLLDNAFYALTPSSEPLLRTPIIKIKTLLNNKYIQFTVEDNGPGIPTHLHQKIFQPFVSFCEQQGIGLYVSKKILNLYGGDIVVKSDVTSGGSKFIFRLPYKND